MAGGIRLLCGVSRIRHLAHGKMTKIVDDLLVYLAEQEKMIEALRGKIERQREDLDLRESRLVAMQEHLQRRRKEILNQ